MQEVSAHRNPKGNGAMDQKKVMRHCVSAGKRSQVHDSSGLAYAVVLEGTATQMQPLAKDCDGRGEDLQIQTTEELKVTRFAHS